MRDSRAAKYSKEIADETSEKLGFKVMSRAPADLGKIRQKTAAASFPHNLDAFISKMAISIFDNACLLSWLFFLLDVPTMQ